MRPEIANANSARAKGRDTLRRFCNKDQSNVGTRDIRCNGPECGYGGPNDMTAGHWPLCCYQVCRGHQVRTRSRRGGQRGANRRDHPRCRYADIASIA